MTIKRTPEEVLEFIDKEWKHITKDMNGRSLVWEKKPSAGDTVWSTPTPRIMWSIDITSLFNIDWGDRPWQECLVSRKPDYTQYIGKYGLFWNDEDRSVLKRFLPLMEYREDKDRPFVSIQGYDFKNFSPIPDETKKRLA